MQHGSDKINAFFSEAGPWQAELGELRRILLDCGLAEEFKWSSPCYTVDGGNVALLWGFKDSATLGFFKGVLLKDPEGLLVAPGENSRSSRVMRFTALEQIIGAETAIRDCIREAVELEKAGAKVDLPKDDLVYPEELITALDEDPDLQGAFEALTPGRRRGYVLHFSQTKQPATRRSRIARSRDRILAGKGMHDR
jgi:uncharacterized protein YdeI (YjbR/CyaY-like superfamily)